MKWGGNVNKISMLAFANIRKSKGHSVSLLIMFFIAGLLFNAGLLVLISFGGFFEKTIEELNTSSIYYVMPSNYYNMEIEEFIANNSNTLEMQKEESLWAQGIIEYRDDTRKSVFLINDADKTREMSKWKYIGEHLAPDDMSIYLPSIFHEDGGYQLNDKFEVLFGDERFSFTIKGFIEDIYFCSFELGLMGVYLPHDTYENISGKLGDTNKATVIFANLKEINKDIESHIKELTNLETLSSSSDIVNTLLSFDLSIVRLSRVMMASMVAMMIVAFAAIIVLVCLIVVRFRIGNSIEDDMTKIGSLKAMGYTSRQIILSIVLQFVLIAFAGSIIGISISYLATPMLSDVFAQQSGLKWEQGFDGRISSITLITILIFVILTAFITARRINKLHPIVALRGGIITHSFRKNHMPLNTSKGSLIIILAFKSLFQNMKQSVMIMVIIIGVTFAGTFAVIMFYNTTIDIKAFAETPGIELSNASIILRTDTDNSKLIHDIKNMNHVNKVQFIDETMVKMNNIEVRFFIMEDYSEKITNTIYEGRYPHHSNEIAIAGYLADVINKGIGESVTLKIGHSSGEFIITGLTQGAYMGGVNASMTYTGILRLNPDFKQISLQIYLNDKTNTTQFVAEIENLSSDSILSVVNIDKTMELGTGAYTSIVSKVGIGILIVTISIVMLVLYFVINSSVTRIKRELGIQKAIGFTTFQLMNQLSIGFLPPIIAGVGIGGIAGITQTNKIMSVVQRAMGIMKANYIIKPLWIVLLGITIIIISYITSMIITYRIRKISAYELISE